MASKYGGTSKAESYKTKTKKELESGYATFHMTESELKDRVKESLQEENDRSLESFKLKTQVREQEFDPLFYLTLLVDLAIDKMYGTHNDIAEKNKLFIELCYELKEVLDGKEHKDTSE